MHHTEVLTGQCRHENATQRFAPATLRPHAGAKCMGLALRTDGAATLVTGTRPRVSAQLARKRTNGALMLEPVSVLVGPLATGVVAIEAWTARTAGDDELGGTPRARAMGRAGMEDARHVDVLRQGCDTEDVVDSLHSRAVPPYRRRTRSAPGTAPLQPLVNRP